jgi:hypothetical protein
MADVREAAVNFEAVKTSMSQSKQGTILRLALHPNEVPPSLHTDWVGSRYMVAMVKLDDHDQPEISTEQRETERLIASAGMLCRNEDFAHFMYEHHYIANYPSMDDEVREKQVANCLREFLGISSRADMKTNSQAREKFKSFSEEFTRWKQGRSQ